MYRIRNGAPEFLLGHPGGPLYGKKDDGNWGIPKGQTDDHESDLLKVAEREFEEETSMKPHGPYMTLGSVEQKNNKTVYIWAFEGDADPTKLSSNLFDMEWPPKSGRIQQFPELDRLAFFDRKEAEKKIRQEHTPFLNRLEEMLRK